MYWKFRSLYFVHFGREIGNLCVRLYNILNQYSHLLTFQKYEEYSHIFLRNEFKNTSTGEERDEFNDIWKRVEVWAINAFWTTKSVRKDWYTLDIEITLDNKSIFSWRNTKTKF